MSHLYARKKHDALYVVAISICLIIFVALRVRWIGHILTWDEAMNICSVRALATNSRDHFSHWFWRHPPLFPSLMLLLSPLKQGFAERTEIMSLAIGTINLALLYILNKKIFGKLTALLSIFFLSIMPYSVFFDLWIKRDHTVTTFGLLAILLLINRKPLYAGLCLGLAFLSKETAVFYAGATSLLWLFGVLDKRSPKDIIIPAIVSILTCAWWYHLSSISPMQTLHTNDPETTHWLYSIAGNAAQHLKLAFDNESGWNNPWNYYLQLTPVMLGITGTISAIFGAIALCFSQIKKSHPSSPAQLWPLCILLPSLLVLSIFPSKVPWIQISIFPAWASLQAIAIAFILQTTFAMKPTKIYIKRTLSALVVIIVAALLIFDLNHICKQSYDEQLHIIAPDQQRGAEYSKEAALAMNMASKENNRVLITSFHYWKGILPGQACPIFAYYYTGNSEIIMKPYQTSFVDILAAIKTYNIDWVLLSPSPGKEENDLFGGFTKTLNLRPIKLRQAWLFKTSSLNQTTSKLQQDYSP